MLPGVAGTEQDGQETIVAQQRFLQLLFIGAPEPVVDERFVLDTTCQLRENAQVPSRVVLTTDQDEHGTHGLFPRLPSDFSHPLRHGHAVAAADQHQGGFVEHRKTGVQQCRTVGDRCSTAFQADGDTVLQLFGGGRHPSRQMDGRGVDQLVEVERVVMIDDGGLRHQVIERVLGPEPLLFHDVA